MTPIVNGLEEEFADELLVIQLNAEETNNARLLQAYGLRGHPTFAVLDADNQLVKTFIGPQTDEVLREAIAAVVPADNE